MSDPLSIAASVAGFLSLAFELTRILSGFISCAKSAPKDARDLLTEVTALCSALNQLTVLLGKEADNQGHFNQESVLSAIVQLCGDEIGDLRKKLNKQKGGKRLIESLKWPFKVDECQQTVDKLHRLVQTIQFSLEVANYNLLSDSSSTVLARIEEEKNKLSAVLSVVLEVSQSTAEMNDMLRGMESLMQEKFQGDDLKEILQWLSPLEPQQRHSDIATKRLPGTGEWFLQQDQFRSWCDDDITESSGTVLTCYGIPGAGKTMISSVVIDYLSKRARQESGVCVSCLYFDYRDDAQRHLSPVNIVGALLKQLLATFSVVPSHVVDSLKDIRKENPTLDPQSALKLLQIAVEGFDRIYICIDALDECKDEYQVEFLQSINSVLNSSIRVFITARPTVKVKIEKYLIDSSVSLVTMDLEANASDVRKFIADKIEKDLEDMKMTDSFKEEIMDTIVSSAGGMFLLPALQIQTVLDETTVKKRRKALKTMPKELHEAYGGIIERIGRQPKGKVHQAMEVLKWAFLSERPLSTIELRHALSVTPGDTNLDIEDLPTESSLLNCCLGLVTVVIEDEVPAIRLVHKSLQEYLEANQQAFFRNGHREITVTCLTYMSFASTVDFQGLTFLEILDQLEFLEYASLWWTYHVKEQDLDQKAEDLAIKVLERGFDLPGYREEDFESGIWEYFITKPAAGSDNWRYSAMHAATQFDSEKPLQLLMKNRICLGDLNCGNSFGYTPLSTAVRMCRPEAVRILLQNSDTDANANNEFGSTPLHLAAEIDGSEDEKLQITRLLLERPDIDINSKYKHGNTPLHIAAGSQYSEILQLLLETPEINVNIQNEKGYTPLHTAIENFSVSSFALILLRRPDINLGLQNLEGSTPLHLACFFEHDHAVEMIIMRQPNLNIINTKDNLGRTPLHIASHKGGSYSTRILLEQADIDVNSKDLEGRTALHVACKEGGEEHNKIVRMLLERPEIDVNVRDASGETPFHVAMWYGNDEIAELLFKRAELDITSNDLSEQKSPSSPNTVVDHSRTEETVDSGTKCENGGTDLKNTEDVVLGDETELNEVEADIGKRDDLVKTDLEEEDNEDVWEDAMEC